jgi:hypothetical protein
MEINSTWTQQKICVTITATHKIPAAKFEAMLGGTKNHKAPTCIMQNARNRSRPMCVDATWSFGHLLNIPRRPPKHASIHMTPHIYKMIVWTVLDGGVGMLANKPCKQKIKGRNNMKMASYKICRLFQSTCWIKANEHWLKACFNMFHLTPLGVRQDLNLSRWFIKVSFGLIQKTLIR